MEINVEGSNQTVESYFFQPVAYKLLQEKDAKEILTKWGLASTLKVGSFRFSQAFQEFEVNRFLNDLFNNPNVRYVMSNVKFAQEAVGNLQFDRLRCSELTLEVFDQLEKEDIVKKGYISKMMTQYYEEIEVCDKLRQCLILEESQSYPVFDDIQRKQLLLKIFQLLVIGGSFNQYEDMIGPYLDWTKKFYKSLVSVRKRSETNQIFVQSIFYEIKSMDNGKSFKKGSHPQNILYVVINPGIRTVHIIGNEWRKAW